MLTLIGLLGKPYEITIEAVQTTGWSTPVEYVNMSSEQNRSASESINSLATLHNILKASVLS
jgi:hypothetical protein